uniref:Uncharacterized protein n=1 Tax=Parascaris equorum TaxID=6256 RepID=A0A914RNI2_PAREQ
MNSSVLSKLSTCGISVAKCVRNLHVTAGVRTSVFMKRQKKIDPDVAKQREARKRRKLEKEIRAMQKHSKRPKPVNFVSASRCTQKSLRKGMVISSGVLPRTGLYVHLTKLAPELYEAALRPDVRVAQGIVLTYNMSLFKKRKWSPAPQLINSTCFICSGLNIDIKH